MKIDRLLAITMLLLTRKKVSAKELSERFEVSVRTIYRDVETIGRAGIPVVSYPGADGGYRIMDAYRLDRQFVTPEELQAIITALKGVGSAMEDPKMAPLIDKISALAARTEKETGELTSEQLVIDLNPWTGGRSEREKLSVLRQAIRESRTLRIDYANGTGGRSERVIEPLTLVLKRYTWYVTAYCRNRNDIRIFRLSRIKRWELLWETFQRRPVPFDDLERRWEQNEPVVPFVLRFSSKVRVRVEDEFEESLIEEDADGGVIVRTKLPLGNWVIGQLLSYGREAEVLEPTEVAAAIRDHAESIVKLYLKH